MSAAPEKADVPECPESTDTKSTSEPESYVAKNHAIGTSTSKKDNVSSSAKAPSPLAPSTDALNDPKESQKETSKPAAIDDSKSSAVKAHVQEELAEDFMPPPQDASGEKTTITISTAAVDATSNKEAEEVVAETTADVATKKPRKDPKRPKRQYIVKNPNRPKRPLSAYNLFFKDERERLVRKELESRDANLPIDELVNCQEKTRTGKRVHRKTHGAIGFEVLGKIISANWKTVDPATKAKYDAEAAKDKERYHNEVQASIDHLKANPPPDPMGPKGNYNGKRPGESIDGSSEGSFYGPDPAKRLRASESGAPPSYPHGYFDGQYPPPYGPPPGYHPAAPPSHTRYPYYDYYGYDHAAFMPPHPNAGHSGENHSVSPGGHPRGPPGDPTEGPPPLGPPHPGPPPLGPPPPPPVPYGYPYPPPPPDYYHGYGPPPPPNYSGYGAPPLTNNGSGDASNQTFEPPPYSPHASRPPQYDSYHHGHPQRYPQRPPGNGDSPRNADYHPWGPPPPHLSRPTSPPLLPPPPHHQPPGHHTREFAFQCEVCNNAVFATFEECADHERECSKKSGAAQPSNGGVGPLAPPPPQNPHGMYPHQQIREEERANAPGSESASANARSNKPGGKSKASPSPRSKQKIKEKTAVEAVLALKG